MGESLEGWGWGYVGDDNNGVGGDGDERENSLCLFGGRRERNFVVFFYLPTPTPAAAQYLAKFSNLLMPSF